MEKIVILFFLSKINLYVFIRKSHSEGFTAIKWRNLIVQQREVQMNVAQVEERRARF